MRIVGVAYRIVRWPIEARGAATLRPGGLGWRERQAVIIAVRGDDGSTGLGEAAPLPGLSVDTIADAVAAAEVLAARAPLALETPAHASAVADRITAAPAARFAVESALLAAYAQRTRTSVASLLARVPQAELHRAVVVDDEHDIPADSRWLKIKVSPPGVSAAVERVRRIVRAAPGARIRIDGNRAWSRSDAIALLAELADLPVDFVEEPCLDAHELLAEALPCRLALDESLVTLPPAELAAALESPQLAALVLKPTLLGGFARCLALAAEAHRHGVAPVASHALEGPVGFAACTELARAIGADVPVGLGPHPALVGAYG
jgi:O-succinylbenzoate synthase